MKNLRKLLGSQTLRDSTISFVGLGVTTIVGFIFTAILARVLGPSVFGVYSSIAALATIFYTVGDLGISSAVINFLPKHPREESRIIGTGLFVQSLICLVVLVVFVGFAYSAKYIIPGSRPEQLVLAGVLSVNYLFIGFAQAVFTAKKKYWSFSFSQIIDAIIKITVVLLLVYLSKVTIANVIFANIISTLIALLATFLQSMCQKNYSRNIFFKMYHYAKWIGLSRFFSVLVSRIDIILLNLMVSSYVAGIFAAASRVTLLFALVIASLNSVVNSRYSQFDTHRKVIEYSKKLILFISGIGLIMLLSGLFAPWIIGVAFGTKFLASISVFRWLTLAMVPFLFGLITTPALLYTYHQSKFYALITIFQVALMIVLEIVLIPKIGVYAPVVALGVSNTLSVILSFFKLYQCLHEKIPHHKFEISSL